VGEGAEGGGDSVRLRARTHSTQACPLSEVERTWLQIITMSANDPSRHLAAANCRIVKGSFALCDQVALLSALDPLEAGPTAKEAH
jgi:hypothetical protein